MAKPTLVINLWRGIPTVYIDQPLDINVIVDDTDDYEQGFAAAQFFFLDPEVDAGRAVEALRQAEESSLP